MPVEEIVVLASSKKWGGKCVAGISMDTGAWLRPVSHLSHRELTSYYYRIEGHEIGPLDRVRFEHEGGLADPSQPENVAVSASRWQLAGRVDPGQAVGILSPYVIEGPTLLGNRGAAMPEDEAMEGVEASLALVRPSEARFHLEPPWEGASRARPRVAFELDGQGYDLALTDYLVAPRLMRAGLGEHDLYELGLPSGARMHLTVSLAEARDGWCTKLVAAVLPLPEEG
jgi:hypothetical protein